MSMFPTEPGKIYCCNISCLQYPFSLASSQLAPKHEELEPLYSNVQRTIIEGLTTYEK